MNSHITPEEFEVIRGFLAGYVPGATARRPRQDEKRPGGYYSHYGDPRSTAIIEVNGAFSATIEHEMPSHSFSCGRGSDRWIAKGPYIPRAGGQKWGEPTMWRKQLQPLLDAVKPHLRVASPFEVAREATAAAEAQLKDWFGKKHGSPEYAMAFTIERANHLQALLVFAADHPIPVAGPETPAWITEAEQELSSVVAAIKDKTLVEAAQQGMREMWTHFDYTHEGAPK